MAPLRDFRTMTNELVKVNTARTIEEWLRIMDKFNASTKSRARISAYLRDCYNLTGWWLDALVSRYELERGIVLSPTG